MRNLPQSLSIWTRGPQLVALFWRALSDGAMLEVCCWVGLKASATSSSLSFLPAFDSVNPQLPAPATMATVCCHTPYGEDSAPLGPSFYNHLGHGVYHSSGKVRNTVRQRCGRRTAV